MPLGSLTLTHSLTHSLSLSPGGSCGAAAWANYRHQADLCHAYQVLIEHGFDPAKCAGAIAGGIVAGPGDAHRGCSRSIIVMMYDDIAHNIANPTKGVIINQPGGPNVYAGVAKDYTGLQVTPRNFLSVLQGDAAAMKGIGSGRVLTSGPNDNVFINFVDHGAGRLAPLFLPRINARGLLKKTTRVQGVRA